MLDKRDIFDARVRERAFRLWQEAGCPENRAEAFWLRAEAIELREFAIGRQELEQAEREPPPASDAADFA